MKKLCIFLAALLLCSGPAGAYIVWVTENTNGSNPPNPDDVGWAELLADNGYTVWRRADLKSLDAGKIADLNAAELVIVSRDTNSGAYDDGTEVSDWNGITTPLILLNQYLSRSNRWKWFNGGSTGGSASPTLEAADPAHPIFDGVALDPSNQVAFATSNTPVGNTTGVGNGTLLARDPGNNRPRIVLWNTGTEFYGGSGQVAGGPRMFFGAGVNGNNPKSALNLTPEGEQIFLNAVDFLTAGPPPPAPTTYSEAVLADEPVAYWRLNETSGPTATDLGIAGADGTYVGAVGFSAPDLIQLEDDAAVALNGTDARVNIPDSPLINTGGPYVAKTVELWFNANDVQSRQVLYEQGGFTRGINIYIENGMLYMGAWNRAETAWDPIFVSTPIEANATYMVDMVLDGVSNGLTGTIMGYLNGRPFDTKSGVSMLWSHGDDGAIGAMRQNCVLADGTNVGGGGLWFDGIIDEVSLYNVALTPEQVAFHWQMAYIPEPTTCGLLGCALLLLARRRRRSA